VLELALLVASIALADSLNPSTILPALYLATTPHAVRKIASFTLGVGLTSTLFGIVFVAGPGQLILGVLPHPNENAKHLLEAIGGLALIVLGVVLWKRGQGLTDRIPTGESAGRRSSFAVGAAIMAVELPTAFPYFAALASIIGSNRSVPVQITYVLLFNALFVLPLVVVLLIRARAGERAAQRLNAVGEWIRRYAHTAIALLVMAAGIAFLIVGLTDLR
jgi:cytochrome c biogenesis protein CcdA